MSGWPALHIKGEMVDRCTVTRIVEVESVVPESYGAFDISVLEASDELNCDGQRGALPSSLPIAK